MAPLSTLRRWFEHCLDLPDGERANWLAQHVGDAGDRARVERMLAAATAPQGDSFDEEISVRIGRLQEGLDVPPDRIGRCYGAFRLVRELGQGGQAVVYLGERADGAFKQAVAVKLLRRALFSAQDLRGFRREREILARLDHPGIARLIDGGVGEDGVPYLVMDHVDGTRLDAWLQAKELGTSARLALFAALCAAVGAAHRQLIVHRDLKPSNVLVQADGMLKVLDFGIARLLDEEDAGANTELHMLTPGYAAPEQVRGEPAMPAADVHALGVILRQILTGQSPPQRAGASWPSWPDATPRELRWIIERATQADPGLRYRDAAELGEDIERYREQRPVHAHPPGRWYRTRKFVARHRGGVGASALLLLVALLGFGSALWQAHVAREQAQLARTQADRAIAVRDFVDRMFDAVRDGRGRGEEPSMRELVASAGHALLRAPPHDAAMAVDLASLFADLAEASGDLALADELATQATRTADAELAPDEPLRIGAHALLGFVASKRENYARAEAELRPALAALDRHGLRGRPLLRALEGLEAVETMRGDRSADIRLARRDIDERIAAFGADNPAVGTGYVNLGSALEGIEEYAGADAAYTQALAFALAHHGEHNVATAEAQCGLASTRWRSGRWRSALELFRACAARYQALQHAPTQSEVYSLTKWCVLEGWMLGAHTDEACSRADAASTRVFAGDRDYAGESLQRRASAMIERGADYAHAEQMLEQARALYGDGPLNAMRKGRVDQLRADLLLVRGAFAQARAMLPEAISDLRERPYKLQPLLAQAQLLFACSQAPGPGCTNDLRTQVEQAQAPLLAWHHPQMLQVQVLLARVDLADHPRAAITRLQSAIADAAQELPATHPRLLEASLWLAAAQAQAGDCDAARQERAGTLAEVHAAALDKHPLVAKAAAAMTERCAPVTH